MCAQDSRATPRIHAQRPGFTRKPGLDALRRTNGCRRERRPAIVLVRSAIHRVGGSSPAQHASSGLVWHDRGTVKPLTPTLAGLAVMIGVAVPAYADSTDDE